MCVCVCVVLTFGENLVALGLADALDRQQGLFGGVGDRLDGVEAGLGELLDVGGSNAVSLRCRSK